MCRTIEPALVLCWLRCVPKEQSLAAAASLGHEGSRRRARSSLSVPGRMEWLETGAKWSMFPRRHQQMAPQTTLIERINRIDRKQRCHSHDPYDTRCMCAIRTMPRQRSVARRSPAHRGKKSDRWILLRRDKKKRNKVIKHNDEQCSQHEEVVELPKPAP